MLSQHYAAPNENEDEEVYQPSNPWGLSEIKKNYTYIVNWKT